MATSTGALTFWTANTRTMFLVALEASKSISVAPRVGGQRQALVSFVFAVSALEAFLHESAYLAEVSLRKSAERECARAFAQVMEEAEESRAQLQSKFHLASLVLNGKAYDKGTAPFQDFSLLVEVRNALVHFKSKEYFSTIEGAPAVFNLAPVLEKLASRGVLALPSEGETGVVLPLGDAGFVELVRLEDLKKSNPKPPPTGVMTSWTRLVGTKAAAEWACSTASRMALDLLDKLPAAKDSDRHSWTNHMEHHFRTAFSFKSLTGCRVSARS